MSISLRRLNRSAFGVRMARLLAVFMLLFVAGEFGQAEAAGITLVQHVGKDAGVATTSTLAFTGANTAGNFIAIAIRGGNSSSQVFTVTDSNANTYKRAAQVGYTGSVVTSAIYYAENIKGGANTVTVSMTVSGPFRFDILEYSGVATSSSLDVTAVGTATSSSAITASVNTTANGDLLLGTVGSTNAATFTAGTGYTIRDFVPAEPNTKHISEDQIQATAGPATTGAALAASDSWGAVLAAFKSATGGAGVPTTIAATAGTPQNATVNTAFSLQLQATVKDSFNNPVSGATVTFAAPGSGASGTFAGGVTTATTNASGVATAAVFTANTIAGSYTVTASVSGVATPANFSLTNLAGAAASITATAGTPQSATINTAFATQLQATVKDSFNNPVSGAMVSFAAPGSGASGTFAGGVNSANTNASGVATAPVFTANGTTGGPYTVTASVSGVASPANFSLTNVAAPPASVTVAGGTPQSSTVNAAFTTALQATVKDASNNPVSGVTVTFTAPSSGASGTFAGGVNTATTNALGVATSAVFTANSISGSYNVTATVAGVANPANFAMTNLAGPAANIAPTTGTPQSAVINTVFATNLQATVTDSLNNPVSGVTVTFTAPASGASGTFAGGVNTATTNAQGVATAAIFTANATIGGPYTVAASVSGVATTANFSLTNLSNVPNIALVQHTGLDAGSTTTGSLAFAASNTTGNFIAVAIRGGNSSSQVFSVSDSSGNAYKQAAQVGYTGSVVTSAIYYAENIKGGANTVTVSMTVSGPFRFDILEYSGVATSSSLDVTAVGTATSSSAITASVNTTANGDLLLGTVGSTNAATFTAGTGYTIRDFVPAEPNTKHIGEDQIQATAGPATAGATLAASDSWGAVLAAFKPAGGGGGAGVPASIASTAGTPQSATVNAAFATQLQATVKDSFNNPVNGVTVTFNAPTSGASGTFAGGVKTATTNASGVAAAAVFTANTTAGGPYTVTASVSGVASPANFSLTNLAGTAASIAATVGTPQSATINTAFATQLQATIKDSFGNPVSGILVTFTAPASGASGTFTGSVTTTSASTNASGVATAPVFTANGTAGGPYTVTASASGVATPANFSLTNLGNPPANIVVTAGTPQSATINTAFAAQLQVTVTDSSNNPVNGATVTFTAPASGPSGTFAGSVNTAVTNASGVATSAIFTANSVAGGPYTVAATVPGVATPANFSLTNLTGAPSSITATAGTPQSATVNTAYTTQFQATVKDAGNNPVSGVTVTFAAPNTGASGAFAGGVNTATTNSLGVATAAVFTANSIAGGPYNVTASVAGVATPANFALTNLAGPPANIAATAGTPQSATVNTAFAAQLQATVIDSLNNPVSGVTVTFTAPASGASGTFAGGVNTATTNALGVATAATFTANATVGGPYTVTASVSGVATPANFSLNNTASVAPPITLVQHIGKDAGVTTTSTLAFPSANTAGNFIAVAIRGGNSSSQVFSVSDSNGNTYKQAAQVGYTGSAVTSAIYYAENIKGGANTVTVSMTVSGPFRFDILEYSGVATSTSLDVTAVGTATSSSAITASVNTTVNGDLLLGTVGSTNAATFTAGTGYTIRDFVPAEPNTKHIGEDQIQATAGAATAGATLAASDSWGAVLAAFKPAGGGGGAGVPASITATAGTPQSATVNTAFAIQLQATVKDSFNNPVSGTTVTFAAPGSSASGTFAGGVTTATTNASGVATAAVFTANSIAGPYTVTASVSGVSTPANFSLTNLAGTAASVTATAGTPQSATINTAFAISLQVTVKDSFNNPVSGVMVTFTAPASGASGTFTGGVTTTSATTNASGVATAPVFTANGTTGGPYTVTGSVSGVATPANFSLTNLGNPPASITATGGTPQSATVNTAFTTALQATVKDASNNPVSGVTVTFTAPASGASGTFAGGVNTATTNSLGVATSAVFTANSIAGSYTVTATVAGVATPANFSLTNLAGAAASIAATAGTPQSAAINTAFATNLQATVTDSLSNPVSGVTVTFTAPASGASGTFTGGVSKTTATTNASGVATAPVFTANATAGGPYTVTATVSGVATPANFSLTNVSSSTVITLVQSAGIDAGSTTLAALAFKTNNTAGNWIAVCIRGGNSNSQVFTVGDSNGNTYRQAFQLGLSANGVTFALYYAENIKGGANTVTVSQSVSGPFRFAILEYNGVATSNSIDATPTTGQGTSTAPNSGSLTTGASGDLLISTIVTTNTGTFTAGSGYTIEQFVPAEPNTKLIVEDQLQRIAGTASAGATLAGSDSWGAGLAAFRSISGTPLPITVTVSPSTVSVPTGYGTQAFTASVSNDFLSQGVTWSLSGVNCSGSACGTLTNITTTSVTYVAPPNVPPSPSVTLTATSVADTTKTGTAAITVTQGALNVTISPRRGGVTMAGSQTLQFTATVTNDPQNLGVTWQVDGNNGGNATVGTVSTTGLFTPGTQPGQHAVTAVSNANASVSASAMAAVTDLLGVYTYHEDNARTGQNLKEYGLTASTVSSTTFGPLFSCPLDAYVYAQPLWVAGLTFGATTHNVVYIATQNDSVYAFDADSPSCVPLWNASTTGKVSFLSSGVTPLTPADLQNNTDIAPLIGITSTPVIDPATNTIYVSAKTRETVGTVSGQTCTSASPCYVHRLHALDLVTGVEKFGGPVVISAANFVPLQELQRPGLLLANNTVYLAFSSHGDHDPYQGWLLGYDPAILAQKFATPLTNPTVVTNPFGGSNRGGIWAGGAGPAADAIGNVYVSTGNGTYDGKTNYGDSAVKLSSTGSILDWFTPFNQSTFNANDIDLGSGGILLLPSSVGSTAHQNLAIATGKVAILYLLDQNSMGKFNCNNTQSNTNCDVQEVIPVPPPNTTQIDGGNYSVPAYWNGNIYTTGQNFPLSQFKIANGAISTPQFATSSNTFPPRGGMPIVGANGTSGGVVWIIDYTGWQTNASSILDAYDAANVSTMLYSSPSTGAGAAGPAVKFTTPIVANAKVYVGGQNVFTVFGLLP